MADTYTLPALTDADINGIVTAGQDGTYNIAYTNLTANQIGDIGLAFENAMKNNLKPVAVNNGDYNDLTIKPGFPNGYNQTSNFNIIAFSGKASDLDNDSGFLTSATNAYTGSPAEGITSRDITNWNNKSNLKKSDLATVASTGDYSDLINKPKNVIQLIDIFESLNNDLKYFNNNTVIDTTSYFSGDKTIDTWLSELFTAYIQQRTRIFKILDGNGTEYILSYIFKSNSIYHINLLRSVTTNYETIYNNYTSDTEILNHITFTTKEIILIYNSDLHKLYIKNYN